MTAEHNDDIVFTDPEHHTVTALRSADGATIPMTTWVAELVAAATAKGDPNSARFPGNWPNSAVYAVEHQYFDRQFPNVAQSRHLTFFDSEADYAAWCEDKREFVRGTDYDFSVVIDWYRWDLGPEFLGSFTI